MKFRKLIFWLHLIVGVVAGVVIFIMSVTGVMLAYERQMLVSADGNRVAPGSSGATRLPVETLLATVRESQSNAVPSMMVLRSDPGAPLTVNFGKDRAVLVDPYTGTVLGEGANKVRAFFRLVTDWHRWLGTNETGRAVGRAITGGCNLAFLFLVVSGFYLWWPRKWSWASIKSITWFNRGLQGKARHWNWHNVAGFWSAPVLFFIVVTGVIMSYPWANNLLYRLTGNEPPPPRAPGSNREKAIPNMDFAGLNQWWAQVEAEVPNWKSITMRTPSGPGAPISFTIDQSNGGRPDKRLQLSINPKTDEITREKYDGYNAGRRLRLWARFVHTGEAGGFAGQTVAMLASAAAALLVYTGLSLAWRRWRERGTPSMGMNQ